MRHMTYKLPSLTLTRRLGLEDKVAVQQRNRLWRYNHVL